MLFLENPFRAGAGGVELGETNDRKRYLQRGQSG
jgi:hypothetical protein